MFHLRPFQKAAFDALNTPSSCHVICIAPTGSGKSLIYEKAALQEGQRTLLFTPLVALARQQFQKLRQLGIPVHLGAGDGSQGPPKEKYGAWIVSPEILHFPSRRAALAAWKPTLLVVDECHCLWEWGEDFRPAFSLIPDLLHTYAISKSLWLTATLPPEARKNLRQLLPLPPIEIGVFDLPARLNVHITQIPWKHRTDILASWIQSQTEPGMVFVATRQATQRVAGLLSGLGKKVITYHGGMSADERKNLETLIINKVPDIVVATSAFGMGMDYQHLSYVALWQAPTSILSLVQTMGRVGRNMEKDAHALVLWDHDDFRMLEWTVHTAINATKRRSELLNLLDFLQTRSCRRHELKRYFDPHLHHPHTLCYRCDFCRSTSFNKLSANKVNASDSLCLNRSR